MEAVGAAASIIAVVELAAKTASTCLKYARAVKNAPQEILQLLAALKQLQEIFENARHLTKTVDKAKLANTSAIIKTSEECFKELDGLLTKLQPGTGKKLAAKFGLLKWPLESKEVQKEIKIIEGYGSRLNLALQVDTFKAVSDIETNIILSKLSLAGGATFDAFEDYDDLNSLCLQNTRVDLLKKIMEWSVDPDSRHLFWLNGMAGTGKSTISRTVAKELKDKNQLGASFFFKEGEGDRGDASKFFTSIAAQLVKSLPSLVPHIKKALEADPNIGHKALREQFEALILEPFNAAEGSSTATPIVIVIDALDECKSGVISGFSPIPVIISLFSRLHSLGSWKLKVFFTSRPESAPRDGFRSISDAAYQHIILEEISESTIEHDILEFFTYRFDRIRQANFQDVSEDWPGENALRSLTDLAQPLFICAATVCRFVGDRHHDPNARLQAVLSNEDSQALDGVHRTYQPILERLMAEATRKEQPMILEDFRRIVGSIVVLVEPLSIIALANLLELERKRIKLRLDRLRSVLRVSDDTEEPVRILHLSFANFLLEAQRQGDHQFWIEAKDSHTIMAQKCLHLLLNSTSLKQDICDLQDPGSSISEVDQGLLKERLPTELRYACRYWVYHLQSSKDASLEVQTACQSFLEQRFLFWFEALSLLGRAYEAPAMLSSLLDVVKYTEKPTLKAWVDDARRFVLANVHIANMAPLQIYFSSLIFTPRCSHVRTRFSSLLPRSVVRLPKVRDDWDPVQRIPFAASAFGNRLAFSSDGKVLCSSSGNKDPVLYFWDVGSGQLQQSFLADQGHSTVTSMAFSPCGSLLVSGFNSGRVKLWNLSSGQLLYESDLANTKIVEVTFSPKGDLLLSLFEDGTISLWNPTKGEIAHSTIHVTGNIRTAAFSPDQMSLALGTVSGTVGFIVLYDFHLLSFLSKHRDGCTAMSIAFSPDGKILCSTYDDGTLQLWSVKHKGCLKEVEIPIDNAKIAFSAEGMLLVYNSDLICDIFDISSGEPVPVTRTIDLRHRAAFSMALSTTSRTIAFVDSRAINLGDLDFEQSLDEASHSTRLISKLQFVGIGQFVVSKIAQREQIWDTRSGELQQSYRPKQDFGFIRNLHDVGTTISHNGKLLVLSDNTALQVRMIETKEELWTVRENTHRRIVPAFSTDDESLAVGFHDGNIRIYHALSGYLLQILSSGMTHTSIERLLFAPNDTYLVALFFDTSIRLWSLDLMSWQQQWVLGAGEAETVRFITFSNDGKLLAGGVRSPTTYTWSVHVWETSSGLTLLRERLDTSDVGSFSFHDELPQLQIDRSIFRLPEYIPWTPRPSFTGPGFLFDGQWLCCCKGGRKILWIPPNYRRMLQQHHNTTAIGLPSGDVSFMEIDSRLLDT